MKVTTKSESLKGMFTRSLKETAADIREAVSIFLNRTTSDEIVELQEENSGLRNNLEDTESPEESTDVPEVTQSETRAAESKGNLTPLYHVQETRPGRTWPEYVVGLWKNLDSRAPTCTCEEEVRVRHAPPPLPRRRKSMRISTLEKR